MRTKAPTRTAAASTTVAVDLGATSVRVVEIEFAAGNGGLRVTRRGAAPLAPGLWNDLAANRDSLSAAITQALASASISGKSVVACMPRRMVTLRFLRLPPAPPEHMRGMVEIAAQEYVLFPLDDVILDYHVTSNVMDMANSDDMDTVLLAAARRSLILDIMAAFDKAGLDLQQLSASALALAENGRESLEPTAFIDVEPGELDMAVIAEGQLLFTRAGALDVQGVRPEVAERREVEECVRSFTAYQNEFRNRPIAHVYVGGESGSGEGGDSLARALTEMLEINVAPLIPRGLPAGEQEGRAWATAIGMGLQSRPGSIAPINLVPNERAERRAQQAAGRRRQLAGLAGIAAAAALIYFGKIAYAHAQQVAKDTVAENNALQDNKKLLAQHQKEHDKIKAIAESVMKGLDRNHPSVDVVYALNSALPTSSDIWLTQFQFERGGLLTLHGETKKAIAATQLVLALQKSGAFTDVRLGYLGDSQENTPVSAPAQPTPTPAPVETTAAVNTNAAQVVPQLPGPGSPTGMGRGIGGRFGGNPGQTVFTPGAFPANGANPTSYPNGGAPGFVPNGGGGAPNFPQGNPNGFPNGFPNSGQPGNFPPQTAPDGQQQPIPANPQGGAQPAPPVIIVPSQPGPPNTRASRPTKEGRLTDSNAPNGRLILAGWQDTTGQGGGGNGGQRGRGRRNRNGNQGGNFDPNAFNGAGGQNAPSGAQPDPNGGTTGTTYTTGSIFGSSAPTAAQPNGTQPNGAQGQYPQGGGGYPGFGRGFGRNRGMDGNVPGGFGTVPPITAPAGGIQRAARSPVIKPKPVKTNPSKQTLTSFVITCRVNVRRKDLIPAGAAIPAHPMDGNGIKKLSTTTRHAGTSGDSADNGSDDADTQ